MSRHAILEIHKDELSFSAGHFTIFSATEREDLHGHNYSVHVLFEVLINDNGLAFDYRIYKNKLLALCKTLNLHFLLPSLSKYLKIEDHGDMWFAHFGSEKIPFLKRDAVILPVTNVTIEELSDWFLKQLLLDNAKEIDQHGIQKITINVFNGPGQSGGASWQVVPRSAE